MVPQVLPIGVPVSALPVAAEDRTGYQRTAFKHWNAGDLPADGCNTRQEVLLAEEVVYPEKRHLDRRQRWQDHRRASTGGGGRRGWPQSS
ncbi:hypothetical protein GCM10020254_05500 [Streptomyces goshikiensis]